LLGVYSCEKTTESDNTSIILKNLSNEEVSKLRSVIEETNQNTPIEKILDITNDNGIFVVNYLTKTGVKQNIGFTELIDDNNKLISGPYYTISCTGNCGGVNCGLEGNGQFYQCSCNNCKLVYQSISEKFEFDLGKFANESYSGTFKKSPDEVTITKMSYEKYDKANILTVYYTDSMGNESTYMVVTAYQYGNNDNSNLKSTNQTTKKFIVDCTGSCDCRERFIPATGAIECTCDDCTMVVTEI